MNFLSNRINKIKPSPTLAVTQMAASLKAAGKDVIGLSAGEPDFGAAPHIHQAIKGALDAGHTKYTAVDGIAPLKEAIQKKFARDNHLDYALNEITIACGGKHILFNAFMATLNPGDEVIIPAPYWPSYPYMVEVAEGTPVCVPCPSLKITPELLEKHITPKTKWLLLNAPSNPTGLLYSKEELAALADVVRAHPHVWVLSDDIYEHIVYDHKPFHTFAEVAPDLKERTLTMNGVSKVYAMTGLRIGYAGGPAPLIKAMAKLQSQSTSNPTSISQYGAIAALEGDQTHVADNLNKFEKRRQLIVDLINDIPGLSCALPDGAFYVYPDCSGLIGKTTPAGTPLTSDTDVATFFLEEALVAFVPGIAFGMSPYFRISFATHEDILIEACARMKQAVLKLG